MEMKRRTTMSDNPLTGLVVLAVGGFGGWYWMTSDIPRNDDMPQSQRAFVQMLDGYREKYVEAEKNRNDIQQNKIYDARQNRLCSAENQVDGWFAEVTDIDTKWIDSRQRASVNLRVSWYTWGRGVTVDSRENPELFEKLAGLKKGDHVFFSGEIVKSDKGCLKEVSLTQHGGMTAPEFKYNLTSIHKTKKT
jgi:hypothetical protein